MATRQIWRDEIWDERNSSFDPQYKLENDRLIFLNNIMQEGTFHSSGNMNNLANTDTPIGFSDTTFKVIEKQDADTIVYQVADKTSGELIVRQTLTGLSTGSLLLIDELYDAGTLVQRRRMTFDMNTMEGDVT